MRPGLIVYAVVATLALVVAGSLLDLPLAVTSLAWASLAGPPVVALLGERRFTTFVGLRYLRDDRRSPLLWVGLLLGGHLLVAGLGASLVFHHRFGLPLLGAAVVVLFIAGVAFRFSVYTTISIVGVTFGVACLTIVLSVMSGFEGDLEAKIIGSNPHVVLRGRSGDFYGWEEALAKTRAVEGVVGATPFLEGEVMIVSPTNPSGALLKGIDPGSIGAVVDLPDQITDGKLSFLGDPAALVNYFPKLAPRGAAVPGAGGNYDDDPRDEPFDDPFGDGADDALDDTRPFKPKPRLFDLDAGTRFEPGEAPPERLGGAKLFDIARGVGSGVKDAEPDEGVRGAVDDDGWDDDDWDDDDDDGRDPWWDESPGIERRVLPGIVIGEELASVLRVWVGDEVSVVSPSADLGPTGPIPKKRSFRVAAKFYTGMYEFDSKYAYVLLEDAQSFFGVGSAATSVGMRVEDVNAAPDVAERVRELLADWRPPLVDPSGPAAAAPVGDGDGDGGLPAGWDEEFDPLDDERSRDAAVAADAGTSVDNGLPRGWDEDFDPAAYEATHADGGVADGGVYLPGGAGLSGGTGAGGGALANATAGGSLEVLDWQQMNSGLFQALRLEKTAMFVILTFIVLVAAFNIVSTLVMVVLEKQGEIAILKSMGTSHGGIIRIFVTQGLAIGLLGTIWGVTLGYAGCAYMNTVGIELDPDVYYISSLPVRTNPVEFGLVALAAVLISVLATLYPAWQAARLPPAEGLRYE